MVNGGTKIPPFWLFLAPPADPVEFLWFKMAGTGIPHIVLCFMLNSTDNQSNQRPFLIK